jgi:transcriptional regulator with GAF, ATPase, and Fis domain
MQNQTINLSEFFPQTTIEAYLVPTKEGPAQLIDGVLVIGRSSDVDYELNDPHVSSRHCQIEKRPHGYYIRDLKSRNGVHVNGIRIVEGQLLNGARIVIGTSEFIFETRKPDSSDNTPPLSKNPQWAVKLQSLDQIAKTDLPVFLQGESGTGKEVLANIIHSLSDRKEDPFISVNCSALTETLVESELFGHVRGSFTGATGDRKGAFEAARGGTLFLDEIGDLPLSLQPKLLRALENREIKPVGSDRVVKTNVRIITATHKNLEQLVAENQFRADLYFRVHVIRLTLPPLRERMEDFEDLLYTFSKEMRVRFSVLAIETMKKHKWPGNIRELKNSVARAQALYPQTYIQPQHVMNLVDTPFTPVEAKAILNSVIEKTPHVPLLKEIECEVIKARLIANRGNQRKTAQDLGLPKSTLHDRIRSYNINIRSLLDVEALKKDAADPPLVQDPIEPCTKPNF